jgi:hypothetical protein
MTASVLSRGVLCGGLAKMAMPKAAEVLQEIAMLKAMLKAMLIAAEARDLRKDERIARLTDAPSCSFLRALSPPSLFTGYESGQ